jgi:hypothetical protein
LASRTVVGIPKLAFVFTSIAAVVVIITGVTLAATHKINMTELLPYLH